MCAVHCGPGHKTLLLCCAALLKQVYVAIYLPETFKNSETYVESLAALLGTVFNRMLTGPAGHMAETQLNVFVLVTGHFIRYEHWVSVDGSEDVLPLKI